ncbi:NAD(P)-dependent oxidoreductase [Neorhizobium galegae]|uniref:Phosphogluconate dehydrogenase, NAD-binding, putative-like protein n=1 Tax=Neorhizobium galegae bv. orientalis str. HAMBI 540 TaxID=1028800 RepID=A0A068SQ17_NEOGA|nr:NAD(P)-dependent oxidoreductase [Neorhizobium galegae]CDN48318.1 Phosphogluconate dehydrogenase, NAD-binding, putative-like protein [Neorhizobium galegae bv. orientalis str. HAMBI 540]
MATIAIIGAGAMGSGIGRQLAEGGASVLTYLEGRSPGTHERARAAGMEPASLEDIIGAEIVLSIVPPAEAIGVAERLSAAIGERPSPVTFVDCNAISPKTMNAVAAAFRPGQANVLDGSIIGLPPQPGKAGPKLYISGDRADKSAVLAAHGLHVRRIEGAVGAASALKMCYAGINKGMTGLGTAMLLAAIGSGADQSLKREMAESVPDLDRKLSSAIPDMYAKAYRWVAEMEEIAAFLGEDDPASQIFRGMAGLFQKMAEDRAGGGELADQLDALLGR